jgi:hypothetical protein
MHSVSPPPRPRKEEEDHTDSDSVHTGEITEVRSWRGIDENGKPVTFVEERRTVRPRLLEQGSERGGLRGEYRSSGGERKKLASRTWRDV